MELFLPLYMAIFGWTKMKGGGGGPKIVNWDRPLNSYTCVFNTNFDYHTVDYAEGYITHTLMIFFLPHHQNVSKTAEYHKISQHFSACVIKINGCYQIIAQKWMALAKKSPLSSASQIAALFIL